MFPFRLPDEIVYVGDEVYLERWFLTPKTKYFCIMMHRFQREDGSRVMHDHPWPSISLLFSGYMCERTPKGVQVITSCWPKYRPAEYIHRVEYVAPGTITIFIRGLKIREWGFHCPDGWVHWRKFIGSNNCG